MTVVYAEDYGSPESEWTEGIFKATRRLRCDWSDRVTFLTELSSGTYPYNEGLGAPCVSLHCVGEGDLGGTAGAVTYPKALVTARYATHAPVLLGDYYTTEWNEPYAETIPVPHGLLRWDSTAGASLFPGEQPNVYKFGEVFCQKYHGVSSTAAGTLFPILEARKNKINPSPVTFSILGRTCAAGTLLFQPAVISATARPGILTAYDVLCRYRYEPNGWNKFFRSSSGAWEVAYVEGVGAFAPYGAWPP